MLSFLSVLYLQIALPTINPSAQPFFNLFPSQLPGQTPGGVDVSLPNLAQRLISVFIDVAIALAVFYLILAGIQYITSGGNPDRAKVARAMVINVIIGVIVIVSSFFIVRLAISIANS